MNAWVVLGLVICSAYVVQALFGFRQIKHFNETYQELRRSGRVAIGRRSGKLRAGTLILFCLDSKGRIKDARKMQGVTVLARFREMPRFQGIELLALNEGHPFVQKENKITRETILNAVALFERVEQGNYTEVTPNSPFGLLKNQVKCFFWQQKNKKV